MPTEHDLKYPASYIDPREYSRAVAEAGEATLAEIDKLNAHPDLTPEAKARKVAELEAGFAAAAQQLHENWERRFAAWEQEATLQTKPPKTAQTEVFLLAQSNGLAALSLIAAGADVAELGRELEAVIDRGLPGEVEAWAKNLPHVLKQKTGNNFFSEDSAKARKIEARCQQALEGLKTDKQRRGEANLQYLEQQRRQFRSINALGGLFDGSRPQLRGGLLAKVEHYRTQAN